MKKIVAWVVLSLTAALVFSTNTWAAVGNEKICNPGASCTIGEFLYDDSYNPITTGATCTLTSRYPNGTLFLNNVNMPVSAEGDGWYAYTFTAPTTLGLYRTEIRCTVGSDTMALDKSFEVQTAPSTLTSNEVASAVWSYSSRTLSTFGDLIADIWNHATRTLTGAGLSSGSIATKSDVDTLSSKIDTIKTKTGETAIKIESIQSAVEKVVNSVKIEHFIESGESLSFDLKTKLEKTQKTAKELQAYSTYLRSKAYLVESRWDGLKIDPLSKSLSSLVLVLGTDGKNVKNKKTIFSLAKAIKEDWGWQEADDIASLSVLSRKQILALQKKLEDSGKTDSARNDLKQIIQNINKIYALSTQQKDKRAKTSSIPAKIENTLSLTAALDKNYLTINKILKTWDQEKPEERERNVNKVVKEVYALNRIPKADSLLAPNEDKTRSDRDLKNKTLAALGLLIANKELLAQKGESAFASTWLELGSIIFKTIITNPSSTISQTVPLKYYLPPEVKKENILEMDEGLSVNFDAEKNQYYVSGTFTLAPNESKTLKVRVDDSIYAIKEEEIASLRKQAENLLVPLKNTSFYAQGVILKSDIDVSLDKAASLSKEAVTPEEKMRSYREAKIELDAARAKLEKLKEIATQAGSVGTLLGFVGGAQTLAVWGLIIIMVAGFVFLALYLRTLRANEVALQNTLLKMQEQNYLPGNGKKAKARDSRKENNQETRQTEVHRPRIKPAFLAVLVFLGIILIAGGGTFALTMYRNLGENKGKQVQKVEKVERTSPKPQEKVVLSENTNKTKEEKVATEVLINVPKETEVNIYQESSLDSEVIKTLKETTKAKKLEEKDGFVKVALQDGKEEITGWVDQEFVDTAADKTVVVRDDLTGYVKIRKAPRDGEVITKAYANDEFPYIQEKDKWVQVRLSSGETGWISKDFVLVR